MFEGRFGLEDQQRPSRLLVASISERGSRPIQLPALQLPSFRFSLPVSSPRPAVSNGSSPSPAAATRRLRRPPNLGQAGQEVQRVAAVVGGVLIATLSKAVHQVTTAHHHHRKSLPFYQSFNFPWPHRTTSSAIQSRESEALARTLIERGREYERAFDIRASVQCFEEAVRLSPTNLVSLCLAAKQWSDLTFYHDVRTDRERQIVNLKAVEYAERAIAAYPEHCGGYLGACISKGRLALFCDNRTKVRLAKEAQEAARTALKLGPDSDLAHHLMGRWHHEMAKLNVVVRTAIRVMYGTALQPGTREEALVLYKKAIALAPERLLHHTEAGRVALELGYVEEARASILKALTCEVEDINAWHTRIDAEMLLAQIERRPWRQPSLVPPGASSHRNAASLSTAALLGVPESVLKSGEAEEKKK